MSKKHTLLVVLALVLVCVMSVMGTVAFLKAETEAVTNTFISAIDVDDEFVDTLTLQEYKVEANPSGLYVEDADTLVTENLYDAIVPGTTLPKTPVITVTGKDDTAGYLFVEVVSTLPDTFTFSVDESKWEALDVTGPNGGNVYVYTALVVEDIEVVGILTDDTIEVANVEDAAELGLSENGETLEFYAYLSQATVGDSDAPADVFAACFTANP